MPGQITYNQMVPGAEPTVTFFDISVTSQEWEDFFNLRFVGVAGFEWEATRYSANSTEYLRLIYKESSSGKTLFEAVAKHFDEIGILIDVTGNLVRLIVSAGGFFAGGNYYWGNSEVITVP